MPLTVEIPIPEVGHRDKRSDVERYHPDYPRLLERYQFLRDTYLGSGGYETFKGRYSGDAGSMEGTTPQHTYLQRFTSESNEKWDRRVEGAYYPNWVRRLVAIMAGLILRQPPTSEGMPDAVTAWKGDGDAGWENQRCRMVPWCLVYPTLYAIVDREQVPDAASAAATGPVETYVRLIHPDRVIDWSYGDDGELEYIEYTADISRSGGPLGEHDSGISYTILTRDGWWRYDVYESDKAAEAEVADAGIWDPRIRGTVPIAVYHAGNTDDDVDDESPIEYLSRVMRRLYNVLSQLAIIQDLSCFPVLAVPVRANDELKTLNIGESSAIPVPMEAGKMPAYIGYDKGPIELMTRETERLVGQLKELAAVAIDDDGSKTGIGRAYAFLLTSASLNSMVTGIERWEYQILDLVSLWETGKGLPDDAIVGYPRRFDMVELRESIEAASELLDMEIPPTAIVEVKRRALGGFLRNLPPDTQQTIDDEFEQEATGKGADWLDNPEPDDEPEPPPFGGQAGGLNKPEIDGR